MPVNYRPISLMNILGNFMEAISLRNERVSWTKGGGCHVKWDQDNLNFPTCTAVIMPGFLFPKHCSKVGLGKTGGTPGEPQEVCKCNMICGSRKRNDFPPALNQQMTFIFINLFRGFVPHSSSMGSGRLTTRNNVQGLKITSENTSKSI